MWEKPWIEVEMSDPDQALPLIQCVFKQGHMSPGWTGGLSKGLTGIDGAKGICFHPQWPDVVLGKIQLLENLQ